MESKNYQNEPRFNGVYFRDNLPEKKDDTYVINIDEYYDIGTQWIALYALSNVTYFGNFGVEHIPKKIIKKLLVMKAHMQTGLHKLHARL